MDPFPLLTYDEASEILEDKTSDLSAVVLQDLRDYRRGRESEEISWGRLRGCGQEVRHVEQVADQNRT